MVKTTQSYTDLAGLNSAPLHLISTVGLILSNLFLPIGRRRKVPATLVDLCLPLSLIAGLALALLRGGGEAHFAGSPLFSGVVLSHIHFLLSSSRKNLSSSTMNPVCPFQRFLHMAMVLLVALRSFFFFFFLPTHSPRFNSGVLLRQRDETHLLGSARYRSAQASQLSTDYKPF